MPCLERESNKQVGVKVIATGKGHAVDPKMNGYSSISFMYYISLLCKLSKMPEFEGCFKEDACTTLEQVCATFNASHPSYTIGSLVLSLHKISCFLAYAKSYDPKEVERVWCYIACHMCPNSRCFRLFHATPGNDKINRTVDEIAHANFRNAKDSEPVEQGGMQMEHCHRSTHAILS